MWQILRRSPGAQPGGSDRIDTLLQSATQQIIITISAIYLSWHLLATVLWPAQLGERVWLISAGYLVVCWAALWLLPRQLLLAQLVWQLGLAALIGLAVLLFGRPEVAFLAALLPLMAVVMVGWPAGLLAEALALALVGWLIWGGPVALLPPAYLAGVGMGGAVAGLLGWVSARTLSTVAQWSFYNFAQAQHYLEEAQQHRARQSLMLKDLDHAYYRLERANAALVAARKAAEEAERFKAEFVANVSHELRTPLNLIVGFSEVIMTSPESYGVELPGPYRSDLNAIYRSAQHLLALVDDVLDLARIENGKIALVCEHVEVAALVAEATETMRDYIRAKGLDLQVQLAADLPPLWLDRLRIRQVLLNLLVNAARFTERGTICVAVTQRDDEVLLQVRDTGRGIPAQDLPKIFEEFRSTEQPVSAWHSGTGLGLPISKRFVELHGGRMGVESVYGQGATFWLALPGQSAPEPARPSGPASRWQPLVPLGAAERIVVVAHDDPRITALLQRHLSGYRMVHAATIAEGAALATELKALALVTHGAAELPALPGEIALIRCPLPSGRHAAVALGAVDLLAKPVARQELLAAIERVGQPVRRVLIVDDDPKVVRLFQRMLRVHLPADACLAAYDGAEALRLLRAERPDLLLLDLNLPVVSGYAVLEQLAADPQLAAVPVIIVSGQGQDYLNVPLLGSIEVVRTSGVHLGEIVQSLEALLTVLARGWHQLDSTVPGRAAGSPD